MCVQCGLPSAPRRTRSTVSPPSPVSGAGWCSGRTSEGPYVRARAVPDVLRSLGDLGGGAGLGDHGQVAGLRIRGEPPAEVGNARPGGAGRIAPERLDEPRARAAAQLCIAAGADESMIPQWIEEGRRRAELRRNPPSASQLVHRRGPERVR
jgi:hypothetical protein